MQDGGERRPSVLHVSINTAGEQRLLANIGTGEIKPSRDRLVRARLQMLRDDFSEQRLFRKVFRANDDSRMAVWIACGEKAQNKKRQQAEKPPPTVHARTGRRRRSKIPRRKSAASARSAAGIAPARISWLLTMANPRKMNSPSPPAPTAAAIVAIPMVKTVATRTPARIVENASGNSTLKRIWPSVIPMPRAASRTGASTPEMPATVPRIIGSSA